MFEADRSNGQASSGFTEGPSVGTPCDATIIIPTFNGERYLERILNMVDVQLYTGTVEVLVIDSGSTDRTLEILRSWPAVRLYEIPNSQFQHGRTRNLAAHLARGECLVFLTQDAVPLTENWLAEILAPLNQPALAAVAVLGRQKPRANCFPLQKYDISAVFDRFTSQDETVFYELGDSAPTEQEMDVLAFYSDVNSATRRDFLLHVIPYQELDYSEDMAFGRDLISQGFRKAYAPLGAVEHSNDLSLSEFGKRTFDETMSLRRLGELGPIVGIRKAILRAGYAMVRDSFRIVRDPDYGVLAKLGWLFANPFYHLLKCTNYWRGVRVRLNDDSALERYSLERARVRVSRNQSSEP